jgi:hypothetical protein
MVPLIRQESRRENGTKMDLKEAGSEGLDGVYLVRDKEKEKAFMTL